MLMAEVLLPMKPVLNLRVVAAAEDATKSI
jgi:hypothetical protein